MTVNDEALLSLTLSNEGGDMVEAEATLDTGFTEALMLPNYIIAQLELTALAEETALLADGNPVTLQVYEVIVDWDGTESIVPAYASGGKPLVGVKLLHGSLVTLEFMPGGSVTIEPGEE